jgi:hypothetical protein
MYALLVKFYVGAVIIEKKIIDLRILNNCMIIIDIIKRIHHKTKRKCRRYHEIIMNDDQKRSN